MIYNLLKNHLVKRTEIYTKAFRLNIKASLLKSWPQMSDGATIGENVFVCVYIGNYFKKFLFKNHWTKKAEIYMKAFRRSKKASLLK
jgi:hypothetical protein